MLLRAIARGISRKKDSWLHLPTERTNFYKSVAAFTIATATFSFTHPPRNTKCMQNDLFPLPAASTKTRRTMDADERAQPIANFVAAVCDKEKRPATRDPSNSQTFTHPNQIPTISDNNSRSTLLAFITKEFEAEDYNTLTEFLTDPNTTAEALRAGFDNWSSKGTYQGSLVARQIWTSLVAWFKPPANADAATPPPGSSAFISQMDGTLLAMAASKEAELPLHKQLSMIGVKNSQGEIPASVKSNTPPDYPSFTPTPEQAPPWMAVTATVLKAWEGKWVVQTFPAGNQGIPECCVPQDFLEKLRTHKANLNKKYSEDWLPYHPDSFYDILASFLHIYVYVFHTRNNHSSGNALYSPQDVQNYLVVLKEVGKKLNCHRAAEYDRLLRKQIFRKLDDALRAGLTQINNLSPQAFIAASLATVDKEILDELIHEESNNINIKSGGGPGNKYTGRHVHTPPRTQTSYDRSPGGKGRPATSPYTPQGRRPRLPFTPAPLVANLPAWPNPPNTPNIAQWNQSVPGAITPYPSQDPKYVSPNYRGKNQTV